MINNWCFFSLFVFRFSIPFVGPCVTHTARETVTLALSAPTAVGGKFSSKKKNLFFVINWLPNKKLPFTAKNKQIVNLFIYPLIPNDKKIRDSSQRFRCCCCCCCTSPDSWGFQQLPSFDAASSCTRYSSPTRSC